MGCAGVKTAIVMQKILLLTMILLPSLGCNTEPNPDDKQITNASSLSHDSVMQTVNQEQKAAIKTLGVLVYEGVNDLDYAGPLYVLGQLMGIERKLISLEKGTVRTVMGVELKPDATIDEIDQLDLLIIPGGAKGTILASYDDKLLDWIRKIDQNSLYTASVCTGGWILAATGLLKGKKATTNWYRAEEMLKKHKVQFVSERYLRDGKYWTAAGVTAGMDMALAMLEDLRGFDYAQAVMLDMEYDPAPPILGGSVEKTRPAVTQMMMAMYDQGILPLLDSLDISRIQ